MSAEDTAEEDGETIMSLAAVAERLGRSPRSVETLCRQGRLAWVPGRPMRVRQAALWQFLIETRNIRAEAFGPEPRSHAAEAALAAARSRVLQDRLDSIEMEDTHRARTAAASRARMQSTGRKA